MAKLKIKDSIGEIAKEFLEEEGLELYNTEFLKEGKDWFLRIYIDKTWPSDERISMDDCEKVSRFLSEKLDEEDLIAQNYFLEVSSPGVERELITLTHYERYIGENVEVKLYEAIDNTKRLECKLIAADEDKITVEYKEENIELPMKQVAKCKLVITF